MPRPDVSEERKQQILDAATTVFARKGFAEARMDDIAQEAELSKGALYLYYKSKNAIIGAILKQLFTIELKRLQGLREAEGSVSAQLLDYTRTMVAEIKRFYAVLPLTYEFYAVATRERSVRNFLRDYYVEYRAVLAALIQRGVASGEFRAVNAEAAALTICALFEGLNLLWVVDPQRAQWMSQAEDSMRLLLDALQA